MRRLPIVSTLPWALLVFASACTSERAAYRVTGDTITQPLSPITPSVAQGREVFVARTAGHCVLCHRVDGLAEAFQGDVGPDLSRIGARLDPGQIRLRIVDASRLNPATVMPPYFRRRGLHQVAAEYEGRTVLSAEQVEHLVAYLASLDE